MPDIMFEQPNRNFEFFSLIVEMYALCAHAIYTLCIRLNGQGRAMLFSCASGRANTCYNAKWASLMISPKHQSFQLMVGNGLR